MLSTFHDIKMSMRTLKTHLKEEGLFRRKNYSSITDVRNAILTELSGPGQLAIELCGKYFSKSINCMLNVLM